MIKMMLFVLKLDHLSQMFQLEQMTKLKVKLYRHIK